MTAALEVRDITSGYGEVQILWGVSLKLEPAKLTALVGSNGSGKTTMLRTVMGQLKAWQGTVSFDGRDMTKVPGYQRASEGMVLVPEGRQLFTDMSVLENLEMGAFASRPRAHIKRNLERVFTLFPRLNERRTQKAGTLSGGEQQMVAVGRGLMAEPKILMIDELSLGLSPRLTIELFDALRRLKNEGYTILLVEQNVAMAMAVSDYAYVMAEGRIKMEGEARSLLKNDEIRAAYLGV